mmetsp:Transcript_26624/g.36873  ORF Transcript_26624/g.36873 Transcript_26624/m.36873 type:complete len:259 (+) Transcript_26624:147-923(+)
MRIDLVTEDKDARPMLNDRVPIFCSKPPTSDLSWCARPRKWMVVGVAGSLLLWLPVLAKLMISGDLGCGEEGCPYNVRHHVWQTIGHMLQGVITGILILPWVKCTRQQLGLLYHGPILGVDEDDQYVAVSSLGLDAVTCERWLAIKNTCGSVGLVLYPTYNLLKRWITSNTDRHPESFFYSSFFVNEMVLALALDLTLLAACFGLRLSVGVQGRPVFGKLSCDHKSFWTSYSISLGFLSVVLFASAMLSWGSFHGRLS